MTDHPGSYGNYVDGGWVEADGTFEVLDPATNEPVATVADGGPGAVDDAVADGATVLTGGKQLDGGEGGADDGAAGDDAPGDGGNFYAPTVLADVDDEDPVACEEVVGPVLTVQPFASEDEVVRRANDTDYGLYSLVWTTDLARAHRVGRRLETGTVAINEFPATFPQAHFRGFDESGIGREHGTEAIHEYTRVKNYVVDLGEGG